MKVHFELYTKSLSSQSVVVEMPMAPAVATEVRFRAGTYRVVSVTYYLDAAEVHARVTAKDDYQ